MAEMIQRFILIAAIPALFGFILWRYQLSELAKYGGKVARKVIVTEPDKATYYWRKKGEAVPAAVRQKVYERDNWKCGYCRARLIDGNATTAGEHMNGLLGARTGNVDHYNIPEEYGGRALYDDDPESENNNLIAACQPCNVRKKAQVGEKSFKWLARRGETICLRKKAGV